MAAITEMNRSPHEHDFGLVSHGIEFTVMGKALISLLLLGSIGAWTTEAAACTIKPYPDQFQPGATAGGSLQAPPTLSLVEARVTRSRYAAPGNGDCGEVGRMHLQFEIVGASWPADLGVRLSLVGGSLPPAFQIPAYALLAQQGTLDFSGGDDPSQPMEFTLQARAVDSAGDESSPIEIRVTDPGRASGGCSFAGNAFHGVTLWSAFSGLLLGWALLRTLRGRRARMRTHQPPSWTSR